MFNNFLEIQEESFTCVECGKKIKSGHYYSGKGPYGICCYKKLFGRVGLMITKRRTVFNKKPKQNICSIIGDVKDCSQCMIYESCKDRDD